MFSVNGRGDEIQSASYWSKHENTDHRMCRVVV
jgi:hypothetical protein